MHKTTWAELLKQSSGSLIESHSFKKMRTVKLNGPDLAIKQIRWLSIDLNSPLPPLETSRQEIGLNPKSIPFKYNLLLKSQPDSIRQDLKLSKQVLYLPLTRNREHEPVSPDDVLLNKLLGEIQEYLQNLYAHSYSSPLVTDPKPDSITLSLEDIIKGCLRGKKLK